MQETSSTIMIVSFAITVLSALFNPTGVIGSSITNLGTRLGGRFDDLLTMAPDTVEVATHVVTTVTKLVA